MMAPPVMVQETSHDVFNLWGVYAFVRLKLSSVRCMSSFVSGEFTTFLEGRAGHKLEAAFQAGAAGAEPPAAGAPGECVHSSRPQLPL